MLTLAGKVIELRPQPVTSRRVLSLSTNPHLPTSLRGEKAFLQKTSSPLPLGFQHYLVFSEQLTELPDGASCTVLGPEFNYLGDGDVIALGNGRLHSLFRAGSKHNSLLLTEQCNNYCLMCSQPPKNIDDRWLLDEAMQVVRLIPRDTTSLGITGGEPTLFDVGFVSLLRQIKNWLPRASLHVLSNGRRFADVAFARAYAAVEHPDLMIGIPVYSDDPARHDYVVQARGAFDETIRGILNLKRHEQKVEIRVVLHKQTCEGLPRLAEFIARNLLFVDHVALMGLEMTGFTRANIDALWIDPIEYRDQLSEAVGTLQSYGIPVSVYNHSLCLVNMDVEPYYVRSISDWKNEFAPECEPCTRKNECGGFFSSGIRNRYSQSITPFS